MTIKKKFIFWFGAFFFFSAVFSYYFYLYAVNIEGVYNSGAERSGFDSLAYKKPVEYFSVVARYPPNVIYSGYQPLMDYLTANTSYRFELKLCDDYQQAIHLLIKKEVVAAFVGSFVYIQAHAQHGVIPILKPVNNNYEPFSRSVLFTNGNSSIFSVNDIKKKKLALPSKESYSSNWMLHYIFEKNNIKESELAEIINFPYHQSVIHNVLKEQFDAGVTREYLIKKIQNRNIRILLYSDPFPTSPIIAAKDFSPRIIGEIKRALLKINRNNPDLEKLTRGWDNEFIYGFVEAKDSDYDAIRTIKKTN